MSNVTLKVSVISADPAFRAAVAEVLKLHGEIANVVADFPAPASQLDAASLGRVQTDNSDVILADLSDDPAAGIRVLRQLGENAPGRTLIATGPSLPPESLLEAMKAGITEYLPAPVDPSELLDALRRAARRMGRASGGSTGATGQVIAFVGAKGGTGVTTAVVKSAIQMHRDGSGRTLLLDFNLEGGNLALAMGLKPRYSILDLLQNLHRMDESLLSSLVMQHESGVHILAAPLLPEAAPALAAEQMRTAVHLLRQHYDLIVVDVARPYTDYGRATVDSADTVCLVLVPDVLAMHGAKRLLPLIHKGNHPRQKRIEVILNSVGRDDAIQRADVAEALNVPVKHILHRDDAVLSSLNLGKPMTLNGARSRYVKDIKALCGRLANSKKKVSGSEKVPAFLRVLGRRN